MSIRQILLSVLLLQAGIHFGCASTQAPRYYLLSPVSISPDVKWEPCITIGVHTVRVPRYLERPQIMIRSSANELTISEFDLWAEPVEENISRVIARNLETLLCADVREIRPGQRRQDVDYRLNIEVTRMDGDFGEKAVLEALWSVTGGADSSELFVGKSRYTGDAGRTHASLVSAQSGLLAELSREMADVFTSLSQRLPKG